MTDLTIKRLSVAIFMPLLLTTLCGCSGQPAASTEDQKAKEQEAQEKMKNAFKSDPTLQPPGTNTAPGGGAVSPGPVPGGGGMSPGPVPGGR